MLDFLKKIELTGSPDSLFEKKEPQMTPRFLT